MYFSFLFKKNSDISSNSLKRNLETRLKRKYIVQLKYNNVIIKYVEIKINSGALSHLLLLLIFLILQITANKVKLLV